MRVFAIRHKPSGALMPQIRGRGYTAIDASDWEKCETFARHKKTGVPRIFPSRIHAGRALFAWLQGEWTQQGTGGSSMYGDDYDVYTAPPSTPPEDRKKDDMEIIELKLTEVKR